MPNVDRGASIPDTPQNRLRCSVLKLRETVAGLLTTRRDVLRNKRSTSYVRRETLDQAQEMRTHILPRHPSTVVFADLLRDVYATANRLDAFLNRCANDIDVQLSEIESLCALVGDATFDMTGAAALAVLERRMLAVTINFGPKTFQATDEEAGRLYKAFGDALERLHAFNTEFNLAIESKRMGLIDVTWEGQCAQLD